MSNKPLKPKRPQWWSVSRYLYINTQAQPKICQNDKWSSVANQSASCVHHLLILQFILHQVAQTRLENRTYRPNVELCRDAAQFQMCHEVREIEGTVKALVEKLQEAQNAHNSLIDNLRHVEEDLAVKVNDSIFLQALRVFYRQGIIDRGHSSLGMSDPGQ